MSIDYRNKTFIGFWRSERLPFLIAFPMIIGLSFSVFMSLRAIQKGLPNLIIGFYILGFILIGYVIYYYSMYEIYKKGYLIHKAIKRKHIILTDVKIYNGNVHPKLLKSKEVLDKGLSFPFYDFNKADIILTDYSLILLGVTNSLNNMKYFAPNELMFNDEFTPFLTNRANIINIEINDDRIILYVNDDYFKKTIKINIKSEIDTIKQWMLCNIENIREE